jgi:hypothetical protein
MEQIQFFKCYILLIPAVHKFCHKSVRSLGCTVGSAGNYLFVKELNYALCLHGFCRPFSAKTKQKKNLEVVKFFDRK